MMIMNFNRLILAIIIITVLFPIVGHGKIIKSDNPAKAKLTMAELIPILAKHKIKLIDWRDISEVETYSVDFEKYTNQSTWLNYLKRQFSNCCAIIYKPKWKEIFLLPKGVSANNFKQLLDKSTVFDEKSKDHSAKFNPKLLRVHKDISTLKKIKTLAKFAVEEKAHGIHFERFVNPPDISSTYSFTVKFVEQLDAMMPVQKNGEPRSGLIEGFTSPGQVYNFISSKSLWYISHQNGILYMCLEKKGGNSLITIQKSDKGRIIIDGKVTMPNNKKMSYSIKAKKSEFFCRTTFEYSEDPIILVDFAKIGSGR